MLNRRVNFALAARRQASESRPSFRAKIGDDEQDIPDLIRQPVRVGAGQFGAEFR